MLFEDRKLIIFDWDGTLMDSAAKIVNCTHLSSDKMGLPRTDDEAIRSMIGIALQNAFQRFYPQLDHGQLQELLQWYRFFWREGDNTAMPYYAGVLDGLQQLRDSGRWLAVATGKSRVGLQRALQESNVHEYFITTRCADESRNKPHPQMLLDILQYTGLEASDAVMVGDTTFDIEMADALKIPTLAVTYGNHERAILSAATPYCFDDFAAIVSNLCAV